MPPLNPETPNSLQETAVPDGPGLEELYGKLAKNSPKAYWRSLEELAETPDFQKALKHEFPHEPELWERPTTRRNFLKLMGSMIAMAGLSGCTRQPTEKIVPYVKSPEGLVPGRPLYFASAVPLDGFARGVWIESHMGRPIKLEGNPQHPDSLGALDAVSQASVLSLYDPDRAREATQNKHTKSWEDFIREAQKRVDFQTASSGATLRILTGPVFSPSLAALIKKVLEKFPKARWHQYGVRNRDLARQASRWVYGENLSWRYRLEVADVILALDSDFLNDGPGSVAYARAFAARRTAKDGASQMNRLYAVESTPTLTGAQADHRLALKPSRLQILVAAIASKLGIGAAPAGAAKLSALETRWVDAVSKDLLKNRKRSLVVAGEHQTPFVQALAMVMNEALRNSGQTVFYSRPIEEEPSEEGNSLQSLAADITAGKVEELWIWGTNPAYAAPAGTDWSALVKKVPFTAYLGLYADETAQSAQWHIPEAHFLESWGDARGFEGTVTVLQPSIAPLYGGKAAHEFFSLLLGSEVSAYDSVRNHWKALAAADADFGRVWERSLNDGVVAGTGFGPKSVALKPGLTLIPPTESDFAGELEAVFRPDPFIGDGAAANNGWLQELPKPLTRLTWDNAALFAPETARRLGINNRDVVELKSGSASVEAPVWILPGQPADTVTLHFGYGRRAAGQVGTDIGFDAYRLWKGSSFFGGVALRKTGKKMKLASTQDHSSMENRHLVRVESKEHYEKHPDFAQHLVHEPKPTDTLYQPQEHLKGKYQWGMTIDLGACIGCGACTVACQSENNIPVVGKSQVLVGREMHWIRVDRYFDGEMDDPKSYHQPVPCMHCENAPCEPVCPVGATTHSDEGLNDMAYNRCVGTRYCANTCSYKVRRFNFYHYSDTKTPSLQLRNNPDVTVRTRGVIEKCSYCVQRINLSRIEAEKEGRSIRDGEVVTACQQTCPAQAITFGDITDKNSVVSKAKASPLNYALLGELGTRPRTTYLAKVRNPNPELEKGQGHAAH